jgi:hypothetical protein
MDLRLPITGGESGPRDVFDMDEHADCARDVRRSVARRGSLIPGWRSNRGEIAAYLLPLELVMSSV